MDLTLNKWSKPLVGGISNGSNMGEIYCNEFRVDLNKKQILSVLKYFNQIRGDYSKQGYNGINNSTGYASRVASTTQGFYETSGGSKITYVDDPFVGASEENSYSLKEFIVLNN